MCTALPDLPAEVQPGLFGRDASLRANGDGPRLGVLVDPGALVIAVDADGR